MPAASPPNAARRSHHRCLAASQAAEPMPVSSMRCHRRPSCPPESKPSSSLSPSSFSCPSFPPHLHPPRHRLSCLPCPSSPWMPAEPPSKPPSRPRHHRLPPSPSPIEKPISTARRRSPVVLIDTAMAMVSQAVPLPVAPLHQAVGLPPSSPLAQAHRSAINTVSKLLAGHPSRSKTPQSCSLLPFKPPATRSSPLLPNSRKPSTPFHLLLPNQPPLLLSPMAVTCHQANPWRPSSMQSSNLCGRRSPRVSESQSPSNLNDPWHPINSNHPMQLIERP